MRSLVNVWIGFVIDLLLIKMKSKIDLSAVMTLEKLVYLVVDFFFVKTVFWEEILKEKKILIVSIDPKSFKLYAPLSGQFLLFLFTFIDVMYW